MKTDLPMHPCDVQEKIILPSERLVRRFPAIAPIAALDAATATTKTAILCEIPCVQELMDMIEDDEEVPAHLFIAHNIIDNLDRLRLTIHSYFLNLDMRMTKIRNDELPF